MFNVGCLKLIPTRARPLVYVYGRSLEVRPVPACELRNFSFDVVVRVFSGVLESCC